MSPDPYLQSKPVPCLTLVETKERQGWLIGKRWVFESWQQGEWQGSPILARRVHFVIDRKRLTDFWYLYNSLNIIIYLHGG